MVKVLQCHHFSGQKVLCPTSEPVSTQLYKDRLFLLTKRPGIQIHDLQDSDSSKCLHIETTNVKQFYYLENQNAVITLEAGKKSTELCVFIYHVLDHQTSSTSKQQSKKDIKAAVHCKTPLTGFVNPSCICTDPTAGNIGVGTKDHVYIYSIRKEGTTDKPLAPCYNVKCLLEISVSVHVMRISLAEGFVLFSSDTQVQVVQLCMSQGEQLLTKESSSNNGSLDKSLDEDFSCDFVSSYKSEVMAHEPLSVRSHSRPSSSASSVHSGISQSTRDDDKLQPLTDVKAGIVEDKNHIYVIAEDDRQDENHGAVPVVWLKGIKEAHIQATSESLRRDEIILGPVKNHPRCSVFINYIASAEVDGGQDRIVFTYLFREVDQTTITHVQLRPLYDPHASEAVQSRPGLQSENFQYLLGVLCYVSTYTEGYLYSLDSTGTQLLQTYQYSTEMLQLSLGTHHLYVATTVGIEIYMLDSVAWVLLKAKKSHHALKLCPRAREPCLIGLQPFFALTSISEDSDRVVVLSKVDGERVWSIYALDKPSASELCKDMMNTAEVHRSSSLGTYKYMLQQVYNYIKASILLDGSSAVEDGILSEVALYLGQMNASPPDDNWQLCVPYFKESKKTLTEVLQRCIEDPPSSPARGMLNYIDYVLFCKDRHHQNKSLNLKQKDAHLVLNLFARWRPQLFSAVIVSSPLKGYDTEFTLAKLQLCSKHGTGREFYSKARDGLAGAVLHLAVGQVAEAEDCVATLVQKDVVEMCVENLHILCIHDDVGSEDTLKLSPLAQLLRKHNPYTLVDTFTKCVQNGQLTIPSLRDLLVRNVNHVHFIQIVESLACDNSNEHLFRDIANILKEVYMKHLKPHGDASQNISGMKYVIPKRDGLFKERYRWLNSVPPLQGTKALRKVCQNSMQEQKRGGIVDSNVSETAPEDINSLCPCTSCNADLLKLQGLTCSTMIPEELVTEVLAESEGCDTLVSVQLICLLRTDVRKFARMLYDCFPHLAAVVLQEFNDDRHFSLMQEVTKYIFEKQKNLQICEDKQAENKAKVYLKDVLTVLSETLTPEQFVQILPPDGNSKFFLRHIVRCLKLHQARVVQEQVRKDAQTYLKKILKA